MAAATAAGIAAAIDTQRRPEVVPSRTRTAARIAATSVDFPALGRPTKEAKPLRKSGVSGTPGLCHPWAGSLAPVGGGDELGPSVGGGVSFSRAKPDSVGSAGDGEPLPDSSAEGLSTGSSAPTDGSSTDGLGASDGWGADGVCSGAVGTMAMPAPMR